MKLPSIPPYALLALSAVLLAFSFPTFHWFLLAWCVLVPLLVLTWNAAPRRAALQFFVTGWIFHSLLLQWLAANIFWAGGWAVLGQQLLCVYLALFWAALGALWCWSRARLPRVPPALLLALYWFAMEWLQSVCFSGFGWSALGYSQGADPYFLQWAALGGVSLLSFFLVLCNGLLAQAWRQPAGRLRCTLLALVMVALLHGAGAFLLKPSPPVVLHAGLFQSNYPQEMKWDPQFTLEMVSIAAEQSRVLEAHERVDLFVWPEALVMDDYTHPALAELLGDFTRVTGKPLFTGAVRYGAQREDYNSSVLVDPAGEVTAVYDKVHLAPFGEYIPFHLPFLDGIIPGSVTPGDQLRLIQSGDHALGPLICFEVLFPPLANRLRAMGAETLVVITNLGWFGASNAVSQELEVARFRAVENRLPLIHAANTGISGAFDPYGRFTPVNGVVQNGRYYAWPLEHLDPGRTRFQRLVGAVPVTAPAAHVFPQGPVLVPCGFLAIAACCLLAAFALGRRGPRPA